MDGSRFDDFTRHLGRNPNRRTVLRSAIGILATSVGFGTATHASAARRTNANPTPPPVICPGKQVPCGDKCCCPDQLTTCGPDCCSSAQQCCDGSCCDGQCYGEELCCPTGRIVCGGRCLEPGQCCTDKDCPGYYQACGVVAPHVCSCVQPDACESAHFECGSLIDFCGKLIDCGACSAPLVCGATDADLGQCVCPAENVVCDGRCLDSGQCCTDEDCPGYYQVCGVVAPHVCSCVQDDACESANFECGPLIDFCGKLVDCGACPAPSVCGTSGANIGQCISP